MSICKLHVIKILKRNFAAVEPKKLKKNAPYFVNKYETIVTPA